jgi:hypothetical protein
MSSNVAFSAVTILLYASGFTFDCFGDLPLIFPYGEEGSEFFFFP